LASEPRTIAAVARFFLRCLPLFGSYQDAMSPNEWSLYHARISFSMNIKMISPQEVIVAIQEWEKRPNEIEYNQLEGFVRQIIGWREYMGIYWLKMPDYASMNFSIIKKSYQNGFGPGKPKCIV
jgi:deoxyribodipyrimidine photolyase-related protein